MTKFLLAFSSLDFKKLIKRIASQVFVCLATLFVCVGLISCVSPDQAAKGEMSDATLESKVLDIIRKNPKVILESVKAYQQGQQSQQEELRQKVLSQIKTEPRLIIRDSPTTGSKSQKIVLAEFSDFQCPYCSRAHATINQFMALHEDKVTLVYKHFPLVEIHNEAQGAAQASWAAQQQGKFWEYHDRLFEQQKQLGEEFYVSVAKDLKLDLAKFNQDRNSASAKQAIAKDIELGKSLGINGTPSFVMNGLTFSGALDLSEMEAKLAEVGK
jgi:protein-disulfide isomerase